MWILSRSDDPRSLLPSIDVDFEGALTLHFLMEVLLDFGAEIEDDLLHEVSIEHPLTLD